MAGDDQTDENKIFKKHNDSPDLVSWAWSDQCAGKAGPATWPHTSRSYSGTFDTGLNPGSIPRSWQTGISRRFLGSSSFYKVKEKNKFNQKEILNQSINQSTDQSINQPTNQSIDRTTWTHPTAITSVELRSAIKLSAIVLTSDWEVCKRGKIQPGRHHIIQ